MRDLLSDLNNYNWPSNCNCILSAQIPFPWRSPYHSPASKENFR